MVRLYPLFALLDLALLQNDEQMMTKWEAVLRRREQELRRKQGGPES
jgi:hypothetical protein